ncbi:MAG: AMP-binding protein, partial [Ilumatobacteraceae bacterium]
MPRLIALDLPAGDEFVANVVRAWQSGDVVLPIDQRLPMSARRALLAYLAADVVVSANDVTTLASEHSPALVPLVEGDALVIATSGTTGEPKGVVHTHGSLNAAARLVGQRLNLSGDDHWWLCIPPAHIGGFGVVARALHHRSRLSFAQAIDQPAIDAARTEGATRTSVVPTLLTRHSFVGWRTVLVGGAASDALPNNAIATYGMTETAGGVVYGGAPLDDVDTPRLLAAVDAVLLTWAAHGTPLTSARDFRDEHFLVVGVDERAAGASGCSIDGLFRVLQGIVEGIGTSMVGGGMV